MPDDRFDPLAILQALERRRVAYVVIGALGRVVRGSGEVTDGIDIAPSLREENLRRLELALAELNARRDGAPVAIDALATRAPLTLVTHAGELKVVPEPVGTRGYDDLRRGASREPLGQGLRPMVASLGDHARMLSVLNRADKAEQLRTIRRLIELERELGRGIEI
jgi:hypothetical protein